MTVGLLWTDEMLLFLDHRISIYVNLDFLNVNLNASCDVVISLMNNNVCYMGIESYKTNENDLRYFEVKFDYS